MMKLRGYQKELVAKSKGNDNVLIQADTGAGKTPPLAKITLGYSHVLCVAHRNILVKQLSRTLAKFAITHDAIASKNTKRQCILEHRKLGLGDSILVKSNRYVCSIDSLLSHYRRGVLALDVNYPWAVIVDEAHHVILDNKWGKLVKIFPNARIIGATATPCRLDQISLAHGKGGVFHRLIQADELKENSVRTLIEKGYLSDFKAYSVPERLDNTQLKIGTHDYTYRSLEEETHKLVFEMAGDAVANYKRLANNKQALVFCVSIQIAQKTALKFKEAGIPSAAIHSKQGVAESARIFDLFERKHIKVLVNVDMISEGVDVPAIEVLIMLRKTASFGLYRQWIGRSLRPEKDKPFAILIDHVGNIRSHGLPDESIAWDLDNPYQAKASNLFPCPACRFLVKAWVDKCPECGENLQKAINAKMKMDVIYINYDLVEMKRKQISRKIKEAAQFKELSENLQILSINTYDMTGLGRSIHKIKAWFAEVLQNQGVSIYDLNTLFKAESDTEFWLNNFTFRDLNKNNGKCIKVYRKWQKSH